MDSKSARQRIDPLQAHGVSAFPDRRGSAIELYPEIAFGGYSQRDGTVAFYVRVNSLLRDGQRLLDYGCGTGAHYRAEDAFTRKLQDFGPKVAQVIGADIDEAARHNPRIHEFVHVAGRIQIPDGAMDLCISDWGVEHFEHPREVFRELYRVLAPGGYLCIRTPNVLHYSSLGARMLPHRLHARVRRWLGQFHGEDDVFPVLYRANTRRSLTRALRECGFSEVVVIRHCGESHLRNAGRGWAWLGEWAERLAPPFLWHELHAFARK